MATAQRDDFTFPDESNNRPVEGEVDFKVKVDDDVEVEIVDDTPPKDRGRKPLAKKVDDPTDDELENYTQGVRQRIKDLTHARHDERRGREEVTRERDEALAVAQRAMQESQALRRQFAAGAQEFGKVALSGAEAKLAKAKADMRAAQEAFDPDKIVEAQEAMGMAIQELTAAKNFRAPPVQDPKDEVQTRTPANQGQPRVHPKTREWQANNPWYGSEGFEEYTSYALGLHQRLVNSGYDPRSDEYFTAINSRLNKVFPELFEESGDDQGGNPPPQKKPPVVAAPASRSASNSGNGGSGKVLRLTKSQVAVATKLGVTPKQYAQQMLKLQQGE